MLRVATTSFAKTPIRYPNTTIRQFSVIRTNVFPQKSPIKISIQQNITIFKKPIIYTLHYGTTRFLANSSRRPPISSTGKPEMPEWMKDELEKARKREKKQAAEFDPELQEELARQPDEVNVFDNFILTLFLLFLLWSWGSDTYHKFMWNPSNAFMCFDYPHLKSPKYGIPDPYVCFKHFVKDLRTDEVLAVHAVKFYPHYYAQSAHDKYRIAFNPTNPAEFTWLFENNVILYSTLALKAALVLFLGRKAVKQYVSISKQYDRRSYFKKFFNLGD